MPDLDDIAFERELNGGELCSRAGGGLLAAPRPFPLTGDQPHYARDLVVDVRHIKLQIKIEPAAKRVGGTATHTVRAINNGVRWVEFDAVEMQISGVTAGGKPVKFDYSDPVLRVDLGRPLRAGAETEIAIAYSASPRRGLYFTAPDRDYPDKPLQAWTQGQDEDSRHWYPCIDFPNHQQTSEVMVTVPASMISIGNGELKSVAVNRRGGTKTYHWYQGIPHVTYLLSQIAGEFAEITHQWQGVPVEYYGPVGREKDLQRTLDRTPDMLAFFSDITGVKYPYAHYAQTFVADFIFGGMENISATTLTETSLLDKRASLDADSDGLLAHELAHQWFGDLLTCRDWSHGWLNEGFATYFEALFTEHHKGLDEFRYELHQNTQIYMSEDGARYRRPIVNNVYHEPIDLFDRHLYEKGSLVLHMIRTVLGDDLWKKTIRHYVAKHRSTNVTTADLQRAIEAATGRNIDWLFDQYVYRGGHPAFRLGFEWDESAKQAKLSVTQTQDEKDSSIFRLPVEIDFTVDGKKHAFKVQVAEKAHNFFFALPGKPEMVRFDPGHNFLKSVEFKRPKDMLIYQLKNDDDAVGRIDAAKELAKLGTREAEDALKDAVLHDAFWAVQNEAARALGGMRTTAARDALLTCLKVKHPKARRGVVAALGQFRHDEPAAAALEGVLRKGDPSYYVEAAAAQALGQTRAPQAFEVLSEVAMTKESQSDVIRASTLAGLCELKDARALPIAIEWTRRGKSNPARGAAAFALGRLGQLSDHAKDDAYDRLVELLPDEWLRVRLNAIAALADLKEPKAVAELNRTRDRDLDGRVIRAAREAVRRISEGADKGDEVRRLRDDLDKLVEENRGLKDRVDKLEVSANGAKPKAAAKRTTKRPAKRAARR
ncbi:MAG: HEAT repeat domain-containing protein [Chloroflexi bacterium]|nr:HEAT repeat domain-containing protein [Chloroflexota bacterium]